jgi:hypothetical protein
MFSAIGRTRFKGLSPERQTKLERACAGVERGCPTWDCLRATLASAAPEALIRKNSIQPRMNTDRHGFNRTKTAFWLMKNNSPSGAVRRKT